MGNKISILLRDKIQNLFAPEIQNWFALKHSNIIYFCFWENSKCGENTVKSRLFQEYSKTAKIPENHFWETNFCFWGNFIVFGSVFGKA